MFVQADCIFGSISESTLSTLQLIIGKSVFTHVSVQMMDILNTFVNKLLQTICICLCFLVQVASAHGVSFYRAACNADAV